MKILVIAGVNVRRLLRQRSTIFFILVFPFMIILLLGAAFGSSSIRIGVATRGAGALGETLTARLSHQQNIDMRRYADASSLLDAVGHGSLDAGVVLPAGYDETLRRGRQATIRYVVRPGSDAQDVRLAVNAAVAAQETVLRAVRMLETRRLVTSPTVAFRIAGVVSSVMAPVGVAVVTASGAAYPAAVGSFTNGASSQLLLFVFVTSLTGAAALIETRQLGISRRMLATPTSVLVILVGEALGRFAVALVQAVLIMLGSAVLFGVSWGDPIGAVLLVVAFCLVGAGAGMLLGSVLGTAQQATGISLLIGLGLAALGGSMAPLEVFSPTMRTIAHATPHAWGNDGFRHLISEGGSVSSVAGDVLVLCGYAVVLLGLGAWQLRRSLVSR